MMLHKWSICIDSATCNNEEEKLKLSMANLILTQYKKSDTSKLIVAVAAMPERQKWWDRIGCIQMLNK